MKTFFLAVFFAWSLTATAQDKITLINGRVYEVRNVELKDNWVTYQGLEKEKRKKMNPDRVFAILYENGTEQVVFSPDPLDPNDFKPDQMRLFVKGEQDARMYYRNPANIITAAALGAGAGLLTIYGLVVPPIYSTIVGSVSPNIQKHGVSDPSLRENLNYREGYERVCRDRKIRNSLLFGFGGFAIGFTAFAILLPD